MFHALFWNDDMEKIRINKYISDAGFCSRREADQLIVDERVTINGVLAAMGAKVSLEDKVRIDGEILHFPKIISKDEEKKKMTVDSLLEQFRIQAGKRLDNDRILMSAQ